jgi:hypothetical protein
MSCKWKMSIITFSCAIEPTRSFRPTPGLPFAAKSAFTFGR